MKNNWPKLSETLCAARQPGVCQSCGEMNRALLLWREHDDKDIPTRTVVCLCEKCSDQIIEPHPRLYSGIAPNTPEPGAMPHLCLSCSRRHGLDCTHAKLKANGGKGLAIIMNVAPSIGFWDGRDKQGRRIGGRLVHYPEAAIFCEGNPTAGDPSKLTPENRELLKKCIEETEGKAPST